MIKKLFAVSGCLFLVSACATLAPLEVKEERYGKSVPMITQSYAAPTIRPGDTWKVYLKASDPDGDMQNLYATVFQYGMGTYPLSITRIKKSEEKDLSGYFFLNTGNESAMHFVNLILTVHIQDKGGHFSAPAVFPLAFNAGPSRQVPPSGIFSEKDLGPIMVTLRSSANDADSAGFE